MNINNILEIGYLFFSLFYVFFFPGLVLSWLFLTKTSRLARILLSFTLSIVIMPLLSFSLAILMGTFVKASLIFYIATFINAGGLIIALLRKLKKLCTC